MQSKIFNTYNYDYNTSSIDNIIALSNGTAFTAKFFKNEIIITIFKEGQKFIKKIKCTLKTNYEGVNYTQTITISASATEFTFEGSRFTIAECEVIEENIESQRKVSFDDQGFDLEGEFDNGNFTVNHKYYHLTT